MQFVVNSLMLGGIYGLIAAGFSLVYGVLNILNVAHGAFVMLGAYIAYSLVTWGGGTAYAAVPLAFVVLLVLGFLLQRYILTFLSGTTIFMVFIFTFGLQMALENTASLIWHPVYRSVPSPLNGKVIHLLGAYIALDRLVIFGAACLLALLLFVFLNKTKLGMAIQATSLDADSARLAGVDIRFVFALTFGLSAALAAAAGSLLSIVQPTYPYMDVAIIGKAFAVAVLGGLGNVPGAIAGGFALAIAEESVGQFAGVQYTQVVAYAILVVVLVIRPTGLFGREYFAEVRV